jgi:cell division protein FtsX
VTNLSRVGAMMREIRGAFSGISLTYISDEDALGILASRDPELAKLVESTEDNPLPNSLRITDINIESYQALNTYIARYQDVLQYDATDLDKKLLDYKAQYQRISVIVGLLHSL